MKERPILFSGPMVRALLAGTKTQTRRTIKLTTEANRCAPGMAKLAGNHATPLRDGIGLVWTPYGGAPEQPMPQSEVNERNPYGVPGDRLWVRETFREYDHIWMQDAFESAVQYRADFKCRSASRDLPEALAPQSGWRPSIFMRRWMSRITLELTAVRVERLNDINEADALAEGIDSWERGETYESGICKYRTLWESINGPGSWALSPWVWVLEFRKL